MKQKTKNIIRWVLLSFIFLSIIYNLPSANLSISKYPGFTIGYILGYIFWIWLVLFFTKNKKKTN